MTTVGQDQYRSPSSSDRIAGLEDKWLSADESWWSGRKPLYSPVIAEVPRGLYLNFIASRSYVAGLKPDLFQPIELHGDGDATLFTILLFSLEHARPLWAPRIIGALSPRIMQSNWRFYGCLTEPGSAQKQSVLFLRTVTTSLTLTVFGRRLARCFPLRRAHRMTLARTDGRITGLIEPGCGSAPRLLFEGEPATSSEVNEVFSERFASYEHYARYIIDQHLSVVIWPDEYVIQIMHLDFQNADITPLRCLSCSISGLQDFVPHGTRPFDCFLVENLNVYLDNIYAVKENRNTFSRNARSAPT